MDLVPEGWKDPIQNILHLKKKAIFPPPVHVAPEVSREQQVLQDSIKERAHKIARSVRNLGEPKYGPMWAQGYTVLPNNRIVFLQQQQTLDKTPVDETLEIDILPNHNHQYSIHIRYDLKHDRIHTYEKRQVNGMPIIAYGIYDQPADRSRIPANLNLRDILIPVNVILRSVETASNKIIWEKPNPIPITPVYS